MYGIFVSSNNEVLRAASALDRDMFVGRGWRELTQDEITAAGMVGYEQYVSPLTAAVNADGSISFTPPPPIVPTLEDQLAAIEEKYAQKQAELDAALTNALWVDGAQESVIRASLMAKRQKLIDDREAEINALFA